MPWSSSLSTSRILRRDGTSLRSAATNAGSGAFTPASARLTVALKRAHNAIQRAANLPYRTRPREPAHGGLLLNRIEQCCQPARTDAERGAFPGMGDGPQALEVFDIVRHKKVGHPPLSLGDKCGRRARQDHWCERAELPVEVHQINRCIGVRGWHECGRCVG